MIHNHEVRSSILRPATRKQHHRILCDVFSYARAPARQVRSQYTMRACSQWDTDEDGMPQGIGIQKTSANSPPAFLGNRHLRSKHGFIRRCKSTDWSILRPATRKQHHRILCDVFLYARTQKLIWIPLTIPIPYSDKCVIFDFVTYTVAPR